MLDGFFGYNQILVSPKGRETTTFTTPWGTSMYAKMPFGLINTVATFQRIMDLIFVGMINKFIVIYLDDLNVFSNSDEKHLKHLKHLKKVFQRYRKYGISLSPKKSLFAMKEGNLLGHII